MKALKLAVAEPSAILRCGIIAVLRRLPAPDVDILEIADISQLTAQLSRHRPDVPVGDAPREERQEPLSAREREIVVCIVKGMTNKQIADALCISTHTVITHRRNIVAKLQIHSPAGLTIYAIVNKLVDLSDIRDTIAEI